MEKKRFFGTTGIFFVLVWFLFFSKLCDAGGVGFVPEWSHTVRLNSEGLIFACGNNLYGQLGDGTTEDKYIPVQIGTDTDWSAFALGGYHSLGLQSDGSLWVWGRNLEGQLGDGTSVSKSVPTCIEGGTTWAKVAGGAYHSVGIRSDGTLWTWGGNSYGQLGNSSTDTGYTPTQIGGYVDWAYITAGYAHTVALKSGGLLWAWGYNLEGQLGDGTNVNKTGPTLIGSDNSWVAVVAGGYHTLGLKSDGSLWAWGSNFYGQLGDGTNNEKLSPVRVGLNKEWVAVSAGTYHTLGLQSDGSLWAWGDNTYGQLGNGSSGGSAISPTRVGTDTDWITIKAIGYQNFAGKSGGSMWVWGDNTFGQLGDGTTLRKTVPTFIGGVIIPLVFSPLPGAYADSQNVTITCTPGVNIYYTIDGSEPTESSNLYSGPIAITTTAITLKARAYKSGWEPGLVIGGYYFITGTTDTGTYNLTGGTEVTSYKMFSSPLTPADPDILANLINFLGPYDRATWRLFAWDPTLDPPGYDEYPFAENNIKPGWSAWFISRNDVVVELSGSLLDPAEPHLISLQPGWNQIGAPFIFPVAWEEVTVKYGEVSYGVNSTENTFTAHTLWKYEDGEYVSSDYIITGEGYWLENLTTETVDLSVPPYPCEVPTAAAAVLSMRQIKTASASEEEKPPAPPGAALDSSGASGSGGGGCFIATACYGSPLAEEVSVLREFRDRYLLTNAAGATLVAVYYRYSPWLASFLERHELPKMVVRTLLSPVVKGCKSFLMQAQ